MRAARSVASRRPSHPSPRPRGGYHGQGEPCGLTPRTAPRARRDSSGRKPHRRKRTWTRTTTTSKLSNKPKRTTKRPVANTAMPSKTKTNLSNAANAPTVCAMTARTIVRTAIRPSARTARTRASDVTTSYATNAHAGTTGATGGIAATASNTARSAAQATAHHAWRNTTTTRTHRSQTT